MSDNYVENAQVCKYGMKWGTVEAKRNSWNISLALMGFNQHTGHILLNIIWQYNLYDYNLYGE